MSWRGRGFPTTVRSLAMLALACVVPLSAAWCAPSASSAPAPTPTPLPAAPAIARDADTLADILRGEFNVQTGANRQAALDYLQAAQLSPDPAVAQRAAGIALLAHEDALAAQALARWRQLTPASDDLAGVESLLALRRGDRAVASRILLRMLDRGDWKRVLRTLMLASDSPASAPVANELLLHGHWPADFEAWLSFGDVVRRLGDPALSRLVIADVLARYPREPRGYLLAALQLGESGDEHNARVVIVHALALAAGDLKVRDQAAAAYAQIGDLRAAAQTLAQGAQTDDSYASRAAFLAKADDRPALAALYAELKAQSVAPDSERGLLLGQLAEYLKRPDEALAWYRGVQDGTAHDEARNRIAIVLESRGDLAGALEVLRAQHRDATDNVDAQVDSFRIEADMLARHGRKPEALAAYDRGLAYFDGDPGLLYGRALLLEDMDRLAEAESDLRAIIAADPNNADALNALGYTLADRTNRYAEAQILIEKALRLKPDSPAILDSLGWVQHRLGRDAEALHNLRRAFSLLKDPEIAAHLGEVLWLRGDKDEARAVWKQGLALDKDNRAMQRVVQTYHP
ncbi:MAG: hypothetical protein JSR34_00065 [Proteobacteria bacterium]|nr:hypothetical protein [Pseudomonadota bacterium]